jgi:allantoin racemase
MRIACLTSKHIPVVATPPPGWELVEYTYANPFAAGPVADQICDLIVAATGIRAIEDGCDAIMINALSDFGAKILRDVVHGPVVGAAYALSMAAGVFGNRYSLVDIWPPEGLEVVNERFQDYGVLDRFVSMRFCADNSVMNDLDWVVQNFEDTRTCNANYLQRIQVEIDKAVAEDSPDAILLGCTCMSAAAATLNDRSPVPVLNATQLAVDLAASLGRQHGPMSLNDVDAARHWVGSITHYVRELGEKAYQLFAEDVQTLASSAP